MKRILLLLAVLAIGSSAFGQHRHERDYEDYGYKFFNIEKPTIELSYGMTTTLLDGYQQGFDKAGLIDFKIGFSTKKSRRFYENKLRKYDFVYLDIGNYSSSLKGKNHSADKIEANNWRFGFGSKTGYVIKAGKVGILPYTSRALMWTNSNWSGIKSTVSPIEDDKLLVFGDQFRFGGNYEGGISVQVMPLLSFDVTYERLNVYPRTLFWAQTGSMMLQEAGSGMIDYFVHRILRNKPIAGSIVNFVLKSAYYYGFSELKSKNMDWPFGGEASLNYSTFKFGVGFTF